MEQAWTVSGGAFRETEREAEEVYEVELKFPLTDAPAVERALGRLAARFEPSIDQVDRYFAHPSREFAETDEALRLRRTGDTLAITWKGPRIGRAAKTRREIELPLAAIPESIGPMPTLEAWTGLLEALGFRLVREVEKRRRPARISWRGAAVDLAWDRVAGLGDFLELEILAGEEGIPLAVELLESLATEIGCGPAERKSYLELLLGKVGNAG
jgi:adenylate cyclase class 2